MQDSQAKSLKKISRSLFFQDHPPKKLKLLKITSPKPGRRAGTLSQAGYVVGDSTCYVSAAAVIPVPLAYIKVDAVNSWCKLHQLMPPLGRSAGTLSLAAGSQPPSWEGVQALSPWQPVLVPGRQLAKQCRHSSPRQAVLVGDST